MTSLQLSQGPEYRYIFSAQGLFETLFSWTKGVESGSTKVMSSSIVEPEAVSISLVQFALIRLIDTTNEFMDAIRDEARTLDPTLISNTNEVAEILASLVSYLEDNSDPSLFHEEFEMLLDTINDVKELHDDLDRLINRMPKNIKFIQLKESFN